MSRDAASLPGELMKLDDEEFARAMRNRRTEFALFEAEAERRDARARVCQHYNREARTRALAPRARWLLAHLTVDHQGCGLHATSNECAHNLECPRCVLLLLAQDDTWFAGQCEFRLDVVNHAEPSEADFTANADLGEAVRRDRTFVTRNTLERLVEGMRLWLGGPDCPVGGIVAGAEPVCEDGGGDPWLARATFRAKLPGYDNELVVGLWFEAAPRPARKRRR